MSPQTPRGDEAQADSQIQIAMRILEQALTKYRATSAKGKAVLRMIQAGVREFGRDEEHAQAILPAELKSALLDGGGAPPGGGGPPGAPGGGAGPAGPVAPGALPPGVPPAA